MDMVLINWAGGGPAGSGKRTTAVGVIVGVEVTVLDGNTVGVNPVGVTASSGLAAMVAWRVAVRLGVFVIEGRWVAWGAG
jgi:hypothetical protein